jgi:hypothetical protein
VADDDVQNRFEKEQSSYIRSCYWRTEKLQGTLSKGNPLRWEHLWMMIMMMIIIITMMALMMRVMDVFTFSFFQPFK